MLLPLLLPSFNFVSLPVFFSGYHRATGRPRQLFFREGETFRGHHQVRALFHMRTWHSTFWFTASPPRQVTWFIFAYTSRFLPFLLDCCHPSYTHDLFLARLYRSRCGTRKRWTSIRLWQIYFSYLCPPLIIWYINSLSSFLLLSFPFLFSLHGVFIDMLGFCWNLQEREFLRALDYNLFVSEEGLAEYCVTAIKIAVILNCSLVCLPYSSEHASSISSSSSTSTSQLPAQCGVAAATGIKGMGGSSKRRASLTLEESELAGNRMPKRVAAWG